MESEKKTLNRLAGESSPYLIQHAGNPVDWYPWGEEAFVRAKKEDKPVFLSIGYSACHWCHVMAHESFENGDVAAYLNDNFVSVKVDREERPDVDHIYMQAVQALSGRGGWPLSVFLTPEGKPFFGGTYFPPENRQGMPGFSYMLRIMKQAYRESRGEILEQTQELQAALARADSDNSGAEPTIELLDKACAGMLADVDQQYGGFGTAPKFPEPMAMEFLLRSYGRRKDRVLLGAVELTLEKMARGGIYDQLGGGFHRYSTDNMWRVPHFEKMLYDNALLSSLYLHMYQATQKKWCGDIACESLDFLLREMRSPQGGFYGTLDADSEGVEGKYYLWSKAEIEAAVGPEHSEKVSKYYNATAEGNFEGSNILYISGAVDDTVEKLKGKLLTARDARPRPRRDEKIIASWNGMAISSLAEAAAVFGRVDYLRAAEACADFVTGTMLTDGRVVHTWKDGKPGPAGFLEDYACLINGLLDLHAVTFSARQLDLAVRLADKMLELFLDREKGVLYDNANAGELLFIRPRNLVDGATPAGNSAAARALLYLGNITGNKNYPGLARQALLSLQKQMEAFPRGVANWLCAADFLLSSPLEIVICGMRQAEESEKAVHAVFSSYLPNKIVVGNESGSQSEIQIELLRDRGPISGHMAAYVCHMGTCQPPITDAGQLLSELKKIAA